MSIRPSGDFTGPDLAVVTAGAAAPKGNESTNLRSLKKPEVLI